jgi:hypothetical protein
MARVMDRANLQRAWRRVKANGGAPGVDGMTVDQFPAFMHAHWPAIRTAVLEGSYQPSPVRRVSIPKPAGRGDRYLNRRLRLVVNEQKSRVARTAECLFLGFTFRGSKLRWSDANLRRLQAPASAD